MARDEKDDIMDEVTEDTRAHHRNYLRVAEIGAIVVLAIVLIVGVTFREEASVSVTIPVEKNTLFSTSTVAIEPIVEVERFIVTNMGEIEGSAKENIATADPKIFKAPTNFKTFSYDSIAGKKVALAGICRDSYYVLLIFKSIDDYRKDPARSYYNTAYACPSSGIVSIEVDLKSVNLPSGDYYLFIADQGEKGSWYNPR